jgi:hypothetical protein
MMQLALVVVLLVASVSTASAECAWILWVTSAPPGLSSPSPVVLSSYPSMGGCTKEIDTYDKATQGLPGVRSRFSATRLVIPYEGQTEGFREFLCFPDTVDPRGPKGK